MIKFLDDTLENGNVRAFLEMIRHCEGTAGSDGYGTIFGGGIVTDLRKHPAIFSKYKNKAGQIITTSAAGAYQITKTTWDSLIKILGLTDFSPKSQDEAALELIREKGAIKYIINGDVTNAIKLVRSIWASLPGAGANQPEKNLEQCIAWFDGAGGVSATV